MSYKLEQSIVPLPGTDTTVACDFEIGESSSKLSAFFPRKTKCTPASYEVCGYSLLSNVLNPIRPGGGIRSMDDQSHSCQSETSYSMMSKLCDF